MGSRNTTKLEYIKQPHIVALIIIVIAIIIGAIATATNRVVNINKLANMETSQACQKFVDDEPLCNFIAQNEKYNDESHVITSTTTSGDNTQITTTEIENVNRVKTVTVKDQTEIDASVVIDNTTYVKDFTDGVWAKYVDPDFTDTSDELKYDFTSAESNDVKEINNSYTFEGKESCDDLVCYKYKIADTTNSTDSTTESIETYIWFDDKEFILRRFMNTSGGTTSNNQIKYQPVTVTAPTPTKDVSSEDLQKYMTQE